MNYLVMKNRFNTPPGQNYSNYNSKQHQGSQISRSTKPSNDYWKDIGEMNLFDKKLQFLRVHSFVQST